MSIDRVHRLIGICTGWVLLVVCVILANGRFGIDNDTYTYIVILGDAYVMTMAWAFLFLLFLTFDFLDII